MLLYIYSKLYENFNSCKALLKDFIVFELVKLVKIIILS